jgi:hypothetical protein
MLRIKASLSGSIAYPPERNAGTLYLALADRSGDESNGGASPTPG